MSEVVFDLTEVFSASTGKLRFYGIMRVVHELGLQLVQRKAPVRYGVFSYAHDGFLEVFPELREDGTVDLNVPLGIQEIRIRPAYRRKTFLTKLATRAVNPLLKRRNKKMWAKSGLTLPRLDMSGKTLVSAARPKLITDAIDSLERHGVRPRLVPLLYDMIPLHSQFGHKSAYFPGKFLDDNRIVISNSTEIMTISEFTKSELLSFSEQGVLPPVPPVVTAIPLVHECAEGDREATLTLPPAPYILTVGATMGRKNLEASFGALQILQAQGATVPTLVIAGALRKTTQKHLASDDMAAIRDKIVFIDSPAQEDLVALYRNALAVVMATRMEGWGLPAGEALWFGTPAICSTAPVLREVCGDLGLYFDPDSPEELATHIRRLQEDTAFATDLRDRITAAHPNLRTWSSVADDLQRVLERL